MLEKKFNNYGQKQIINNFDKIIKIGNKFLQVRLIETQKWRKNTFTKPMPRAKFIRVEELEDPYYLVKRSAVIKAQKQNEN